MSSLIIGSSISRAASITSRYPSTLAPSPGQVAAEKFIEGQVLTITAPGDHKRWARERPQDARARERERERHSHEDYNTKIERRKTHHPRNTAEDSTGPQGIFQVIHITSRRFLLILLWEFLETTYIYCWELLALFVLAYKFLLVTCYAVLFIFFSLPSNAPSRPQ